MLSQLVSVMLLAQHTELTPAQKQINALVAQIRRLAASEPVVYGIDTRLRMADVLTAKYPKIAKESLRDAQSSLAGVIHPDEQDTLRIRMIELMAPIDLEEAEHIVASIRREREHDYIAQAYDKLVQFAVKNNRDPREMISKGLAAGGFRSISAEQTLQKLKTSDSAGAAELFSEILSAFPAQTANDQDVYFLLECTKEIEGLNRPLAVEAIDKALRTAVSQKMRLTPAQKQKMLRQIAAQLGAIDPEMLERYKSENEELSSAMSAPEIAKAEEEHKADTNTPDLSAFAYSEALSEARKIESAAERTAALIEIYRRESITAQQRASVASEALSSAAAMPITNDRLVVLAMISRDFARINQPASAAFAAQLLSETFTKACDCESVSCDHGGEKFDCLDLIGLFAEYLDEFKITPESMNLNNISLESRLLILKLYPLLGLKTPSLWFSPN